MIEEAVTQTLVGPTYIESVIYVVLLAKPLPQVIVCFQKMREGVVFYFDRAIHSASSRYVQYSERHPHKLVLFKIMTLN
jgi:hypothetical protein